MQKAIMILLGLTLGVSCGKGTVGGSPFSKDAHGNKGSGESEQVPSFDKYASTLKTLDYKKDGLQMDDLRYNQFFVSRNKSNKNLNYIEQPDGLRTVKLTGKKIILGSNQKQKFFDLINKAKDIEKLIIHAEQVEVYEPIYLHGSDIEIKAKSLTFFGEGKFITTPITKTEKIKQFANGANGENAGNIDLVVEKISQDLERVRFDLTGGSGQQAGPGQDGAPGTKADIVYGSDYFYYEHEKCVTFRRGGPIYDRYKQGSSTRCEKDNKKGRRSTNGTDAKVGGKPGEPGKGGDLTSTVDLGNVLVANACGKAGAADTVRIGGAPGAPATTCAYHKLTSRTDTYKRRSRGRYACQTVKKGKDASPKQAVQKLGVKGLVSIAKTNKSWVTDGFLSAHLKYIKETYLANNIFYTQNLINELKEHLEIAEKSLVATQVAYELNEIESKISMNLDFFGKKIGWVPNLAFEVNYELFVKEVKRNIKLVYLAHTIRKDLQNGIVKLEQIKELQNSLEEKIAKRRESISEMVNGQVLNSELIGELSTAQNEFEYELKLVEAEIRRRAKKNLEPKKKSFFDKAVKVFAAASKVIPVGQPALAAAGAGIEFIHNATNGSRTTSEILSELPEVYGQFQKADFKKSMGELNQAMDDMSPRHIPNLRTMEQKKAYFEKVKNFTLPIYQEVSKQLSMQKERKVSQSALEKEIARLKKGHPLFNKLSEKLNILLYKKTEASKKIESLLAEINKHQVEITQDSITGSYLYDDIQELVNEDAIGFSEQMDSLYATSLRRIEYYDYLLSKSFSYRFLSPTPVGNNLSVRLERVLAQLENDSGMNGHLEKMWSVYNESLSTYVATIVDKFETEGSTQSLSLDMELTQSELNRLNAGKSIYINLVERNIFGSKKEDIRIEDIEAINNVSFKQGAGNFDVITTHLGESILERDDQSYYFNISGEKNHWIWTSNYNHISGNIYSNEVSVADGTLLNSITDSHVGIRKAFASPGAKGFIKVKLDKYSNPQLELSRLMLRIDYTFRDKKLK